MNNKISESIVELHACIKQFEEYFASKNAPVANQKIRDIQHQIIYRLKDGTRLDDSDLGNIQATIAIVTLAQIDCEKFKNMFPRLTRNDTQLIDIRDRAIQIYNEIRIKLDVERFAVEYPDVVQKIDAVLSQH